MNVISEGNTGMSSLERVYGVRSSKAPVPVFPLDSYDFENVDFIKLDVERHEISVLRGAMNLLSRCKPLVFIEDHLPNKPNSGVGFLERIGYQRLPLPLNRSGYDISDKGRDNYLMGHHENLQ